MKTLKKSIIATSILALGMATMPAKAEINIPFISAVAGQSNNQATPSLADMLDKVRPAVVSISVEGKAKEDQGRSRMRDLPEEFQFFFGDMFSDRFGGDSRPRQFRGLGSGVIINAEKGYVITNNHVIKDADKITIQLDDGREFKAKLVGADPQSDVALVQIENPKNLTALKFADSDKLRVGDFSVAIGNPFGLGQTVTSGIISALGRSTGDADEGYQNYIQTDAAVNQGNSGGALVNVQGELVGINAMLYSQTGSYSGYGFAIPTTIMNKVVDDIKKYGSVQRVTLGIQGGDVLNYINSQKEDGKNVDLGTNEGVYVAEVVSEDGNGAALGLMKGDVITKFDNQKITRMSELQQALNGKRPGDKVTITYLRNKKEITKTITLKNAQGTTKIIEQADIDVLGGQFRPVTEAMKKQLNINYGLEVLKVNNGALKSAGINRGFIIQNVNDNMVKSIDDLQGLVKKASTSKDPVLYIQGIYPTGKKAYFAVPLGD